MPFKNYWTDLLEIFTESVKVYTHCVCVVSQRSESNCVFDSQEIEITYKNYSTLNTWATLMKQKLNYSQYVEQEQDIFRYVKNSELTREIRCHSDRIFPNLHQCYQWYSAPPPPCLRVFQDVVAKFWHVCNLRLPFHYLPKFTIFGKYVRLSVCPSVCLLVCQFCQA